MDITKSDIRKKALERMIKDTPLNYVPKALEIVSIDFNGAGNGNKECTQDGAMAYQCALLLWATHNVAYGQKCCDILEDWASKNRVFKGNNAPLEASWCMCSMARAAELIKWYPKDVAKRWSVVETKFFAWIDNVMSPSLRDASIWRWRIRNNWHLSNICARMQIAILREDQIEWAWCVQTYCNILPQVMISGTSGCRGEICETRRDLTHSQFLLGGMSQVPELAWHQGVQIYDKALVDCYELQSALLQKEVPVGFKPEDIKVPYGYWAEPIYEVAYAHFKGRMGISMPKTETLIRKLRPERVTFHWGAGTLTHAT